VASLAEGFSPHSGGTVPDFHRVPSPLARSGGESTIGTRVLFRRLLSRWLPVVVWCGVIFAFSSIPSLNSGLGTSDLVLRKCAHMTEYAILAVLLLRATRSPRAALALAFAYAVTDEIHQHFVSGRHASPVDVAIDTAGALIGLGVAGWLAGRTGPRDTVSQATARSQTTGRETRRAEAP
jgi:VanZ family protein